MLIFDDMTNNQNFKKGDRVRVKSTDIEDIVIDVCNGNVFLKDNGYWSVKALELVEPYDRRTAFLTRLQSLMREFNAEMHFSTNSSNFEIYFCDGHKVVDSIFYPLEFPEFYEDEDDYIGNLFLTADNIMDFDKE